MRSDADVREIAYGIWHAEGRPHGRDKIHWFQAKRLADESDDLNDEDNGMRKNRKRKFVHESVVSVKSADLPEAMQVNAGSDNVVELGQRTVKLTSTCMTCIKADTRQASELPAHEKYEVGVGYVVSAPLIGEESRHFCLRNVDGKLLGTEAPKLYLFAQHWTMASA